MINRNLPVQKRKGKMRRRAFVLLLALPPALAACDGAREAARPALPGAVADRIVVEKAARRMHLMRDGAPLKTYHISLGRNPIGHKQQVGDSRTPEGTYVIDTRNPQSRFHLSLRVSYPNNEDRRRAASRGVSPGGDIFIHGVPNGTASAGLFTGRDWTDGCIAVTNGEIREIWAMVKDGTAIEIRP
jgi:murein L,D-transpeptidase YafK